MNEQLTDLDIKNFLKLIACHVKDGSIKDEIFFPSEASLDENALNSNEDHDQIKIFNSDITSGQYIKDLRYISVIGCDTKINKEIKIKDFPYFEAYYYEWREEFEDPSFKENSSFLFNENDEIYYNNSSVLIREIAFSLFSSRDNSGDKILLRNNKSDVYIKSLEHCRQIAESWNKDSDIENIILLASPRIKSYSSKSEVAMTEINGRKIPDLRKPISINYSMKIEILGYKRL